MSGKVTPAVRAAEQAFTLLEYDYDPAADAIGMRLALHRQRYRPH